MVDGLVTRLRHHRSQAASPLSGTVAGSGASASPPVAFDGSLIAEKANVLWLSMAPSSQRRRTCCGYRRLPHRREGRRVVAIGGFLIAEKANALWLSMAPSSQRRRTRCGYRRLPHRREGERVVAIGGSLIAEKANVLWLSMAPSSQRRRTRWHSPPSQAGLESCGACKTH
eukprot:COSAG02_NODE_512_length_20850_cov_4.993302_12_plen_171_part_00